MIGLPFTTPLLAVELAELVGVLEGAVLLHRLRPRHRGRARDVAGALRALLLVARHRDQLAGELLRRAHVHEPGARVERAEDLVAVGADRLVALVGREGLRVVGRDVGGGRTALRDPLLARAVHQPHVVVAVVLQVPVRVGGEPVVAVAVEDDRVVVRDAAAAEQLAELGRAQEVALDLVLEVLLPVEADRAGDVRLGVEGGVLVDLDDADGLVAQMILDPLRVDQNVIGVFGHGARVAKREAAGGGMLPCAHGARSASTRASPARRPARARRRRRELAAWLPQLDPARRARARARGALRAAASGGGRGSGDRGGRGRRAARRCAQGAAPDDRQPARQRLVRAGRGTDLGPPRRAARRPRRPAARRPPAQLHPLRGARAPPGAGDRRAGRRAWRPPVAGPAPAPLVAAPARVRGAAGGARAAPEDAGRASGGRRTTAPRRPLPPLAAVAPTEDQIAAAAEVLVAARTRRQIAAAVAWNAMIALAVLLTLATIAVTVAGILGAQL